MSKFQEIDGSVLEGGGQILRISIALSAILGVPVRVTKIRAGRSKPGLAAQHLKGIQLVADMCQAKLKGAEIGSTEIEFTPGRIRGGHYEAHIHSAGSIALLLQAALPCALMADGTVILDLRGGTNAEMAPQIDYMIAIFKFTLGNFGGTFDLDIIKRGYFPKGGGHVIADVSPVHEFLSPDLTERGVLRQIIGWSYVAGGLPIEMADQMAEGAKQEILSVSSGCRRVNIDCYEEDRSEAPDKSNGIMLLGETSTGVVLWGDAVGRGAGEAAAREAGARAGAALRAAVLSGACVDEHLQDQLIIYMALGSGKSSVLVGELTLHTKTAIHIAELMAKVKFTIKPSGQQNIIECVGKGIKNGA